MTTRNRKLRVCSALAVSVACCILLAAALRPSVTQAAPFVLPSRSAPISLLPPRPTPDPAPTLPPRPTPEPTPRSTSPSRLPAGGFIELRFQTTQERIWSLGHWQELWTIVQWQDHWGDWHDVEGWQGTFDEFDVCYQNEGGETVCEGQKVWWVAQADFGKGPFRWVVYRGPGGRLFAQSESFYLPHFGEIVRVEMSLVP